MVNFGLNSASILGLFLAVAGASLYFIRSVRPELSRDHDIFFAAVGLLCGLILLFQGWRLDPILQFGQFLLTGSTIFFAVETIRMRATTAEQAKRSSSSFVDEERPVSRVYRAELDRLEGYDPEEIEDSPRLRGYVDRPSSRNSPYEADEPRSRNSRSKRITDPYGGREATGKRPSRSSRTTRNTYDDAWTDTPAPRKSRKSSASRSRKSTSEPPSRSSSRRSESYSQRPYNYYEDPTEPRPTDYVDYQPIEPTEDPNGSDWTEPIKSEDRESKSRPKSEPPNNFDY